MTPIGSFRSLIGVGLAACVLVPAGRASAQDRPNILWLTCEDSNVDWIGCYGNPHADTPNIDRLAREGFRYSNVFANAPVCAPSRSGWITGMHALSTGTLPMRSRNIIPHDGVPYYPDLMRAGGYYAGNDQKTDYNIGGRADEECWDMNGTTDWDALKTRQPFFQVINLFASHESKAHGEVENTLHAPEDTALRAYHPDVPDIRKNYAKYHDAVKRMDTRAGELLDRLEAAGLADNTIVIFNSDHGGVLPRSKRFLFNTGLHCPLVVRIPERYRHLWPAESPGAAIERMVSFIDMPKTWLSLTGSAIPETMQGRIFLGPDAESETDLHFAYRGRMDERFDNARAVCDKRFLYIRNYMPYVPWMQHLDYMWKLKAAPAWEEEVRAGRADEVQARFFARKGFSEELYDMQADPDSVKNLVNDPRYRAVADRLRAGLRAQQLKFGDTLLMPESEIVRLASSHGTTIFELVRDPGRYDLVALLAAADLALAREPGNLPRLREMLSSDNVGIRYWGIVGCFLLSDEEAVEASIDDESHEVRAMAAWLAIKTGKAEAGLQTLEDMLRQDSYATLKILNIIDWMGQDGTVLMTVIRAMTVEDNEAIMQAYLLAKSD